MKLLLLCLGFYLTIFSNARAQDSSHIVTKDTLSVLDSVPLQDRDSTTAARQGNAKTTDSLKSVQKQKGVPTRTDTATTGEDTIVDIFSEMRKASQQQDQSMKTRQDPQSKIKKNPAPSADSTAVQDKPDTSGSSTGHTDSSQTPAENQHRESSTDTTNQGNSENTKSANTSGNETLPAPATPKKTDSSDSGSLTSVATPVAKQNVDTTNSILAPTGNQPTTKDTTQDKTPSMAVGSPISTAADSSGNGQNAASSRDASDADSGNAAVSATDTAAGTDTIQKAKIESLFQMVDKQAVRDSIASIQEQKSDADTTKPLVSAAPKADTAKAGKEGTDADSLGQTRSPSNIQTGLDSSRSNLAGSLEQKRIDSPKVGTPFEQLFKPYRKFNKNTSIESTTSLTIMQQDVNYKTTADFTTEYQRSGTQGDNFLFDVIVSKLNTEVETMGVQLKYDSNHQTDSTSTFAKPLFDIVGKRTYLKVDTTGKIAEIDTSALARQVNTVLSGLSLSGSDFEVGSNFGLLLDRGKDSMALGQLWQEATTQGKNKRLTEYKIQNILSDELIVVISGTVEQTGEIVSDDVAFKTQFTGTQQGKLHVDRQTGLIKSKELTLNLKGTVLYKDNALPASAVSKIKETVTYN